MDSQHYPYPPTSEYFADPERLQEMVRLNLQGHFITEGLGGLLPEFDGSQIQHITSVIDLACGPGEWVLNMSERFLYMSVKGVDISDRMIEYAQVQAEAYGLQAEFTVMDITRPLDLPAASFDLVNARMVSSFVSTKGWATLLQEIARLLHPGGFIRLTECELPVSNSKAHEHLNDLLAQALSLTGKTFSSSGRSVGIITALPKLLQDAGYNRIQLFPRTLQFRPGTTPTYSSFIENFRSFTNLLPHFIHLNLISEEEFHDLHTQALFDMEQDWYCCFWQMVTALGEKPVSPDCM